MKLPDLEALRPLMAPRSVAVVGASPRGNRGTAMLRNLRRFGFRGRLYAVHPQHAEVEDVPCYPSLAALPEPVEFVALALGAPHVGRVLREAGAIGARAALVIAGGFGEGSGRGRELVNDLQATCREFGIKLCGPNCYGILNVHGRAAPFGGDIVSPLNPGGIGFVFQSGAVSHAICDTAIGRGLGISYLVTSGNEAVVELSEYVHWLVEDAETRLVVTFIEGLRDPARFAAVAQHARRRGKAIIALKVGRSSRGQRATLAHTGAVAGADHAYDGFFRQNGVVRVDDLDELIETALLFQTSRAPDGCGLAIASISGGITTLVADLAESAGLDLPPPATETRAALEAVLPGFAAPSNPLDVTGALAETPGILPQVVAAFAGDPAFHAVALAFNTPQGSEPQRWLYRAHARLLAEAQRQTAKPLVAFAAASGAVDPEVVAPLGAAGIPFLMGMRESLLALGRWTGYHARRHRADGVGRLAGGRGLTRADEWRGTRVLTERLAAALLARYGVPGPRQEEVEKPEAAVQAAKRLGFPVALKIDSPDLAHKTEVGAVRLSLRTPDEVAEGYETMMHAVRAAAPAARVAGVLVQEMVPPGVEVLLGVTRDPQLGLQVAVGLGGVFVELLRSVALRPVPLHEDDAWELVNTPPLGRMLDSVRGRGRADRAALVEAVLAVSDLAADLGEILLELDVNPLVVLPEGQGVRAVDALIVLREDARYVG